MSLTVAIARGKPEYPREAPFHPGEPFPEARFAPPGRGTEPNGVYALVREVFTLLGWDSARVGTPLWNPLAQLIHPGDTVVLKPNFVRDFHETDRSLDGLLTTHGSVIRAVCDYCQLALQGRGRLVVADAPQNDADFEVLRQRAGLESIAEVYRSGGGVPLEVYDLRPECAEKIDGVIVGHRALRGDPAGYVRVDLGSQSAFAEVHDLCDRLYGAEYDQREVVAHHHGGVHEYLVSRTVLDADVVISLPKLKTHKKVGVTLNLKNLVGINGNKNWLPHYRLGTPAQGGDQFDREGVKHRAEIHALNAFKRLFPYLGPMRRAVAAPVKALGKRVFGDTDRGTVRSGNWHGNDTAWRMAIDLGRVLLFSDPRGTLHDTPQRRYLSVVDAVVGGEGDGPLAPRPRPVGAIVAGTDPVAVDLVCTQLMGFDARRLPILARATEPHPLPLTTCGSDDVTCLSNHRPWSGPMGSLPAVDPPFAPHFGWRGAIEASSPAGVMSSAATESRT